MLQPGPESGSSRVADEPQWEDTETRGWLSFLVQPAQPHYVITKERAPAPGAQFPGHSRHPRPLKGLHPSVAISGDSLRPPVSWACPASAPHLLGDLGQGADFVRASFLCLQNEGALTPLGQAMTVEYLPGVRSCSDERI